MNCARSLTFSAGSHSRSWYQRMERRAAVVAWMRSRHRAGGMGRSTQAESRTRQRPSAQEEIYVRLYKKLGPQSFMGPVRATQSVHLWARPWIRPMEWMDPMMPLS